jgi:dTMP kinase
VAPGRLLVLEGAEGAGKSTQIAMLAQDLRARGIPHLVVREPGGTPAGELIREALLDPAHELTPAAEALLFLASRAELVTSVVRPALDDGRLVIADRFFLSTYAYQIDGRGLPEGPVRAANALATGGLVPDLTIVLRHRSADGLARADRRGARDRIERAPEAFHAAVEAAFDRFADPRWQAGHPECGPILAIDGGGAPDAVFERLRSALADRWPETFPPDGRSEQS